MLAKRYAELQLSSAAAADRRKSSVGLRQRGPPSQSGAEKRVNVNVLKDFYMKRLETQKNAFGATAGSGSGTAGGVGAGVSGAGGSSSSTAFYKRPRIALPKSDETVDGLVLCLNTGDLVNPDSMKPSAQMGVGGAPLNLDSLPPDEQVGSFNQRLENFLKTLNERIEKSSLKANVMRHLTQVRYQLDVALRWTMGCADIGVLSDHTVQTLGGLVSSALTLVPQEYVIAKRVHMIVRQKERFLRKLKIESGQLAAREEDKELLALEEDDEDRVDGGKSEVTSVVEMTSNCGTEFSATDITASSKASGFPYASGPLVSDVANLSSLGEMSACRTEDEKRRWFYSQCLTVKLQCTDKDKARKTLISDLYDQCKRKNVPMEKWSEWIRAEFGVVGAADPRGADSPGGSPLKGAGSPIPGVSSSGVAPSNSCGSSISSRSAAPAASPAEMKSALTASNLDAWNAHTTANARENANAIPSTSAGTGVVSSSAILQVQQGGQPQLGASSSSSFLPSSTAAPATSAAAANRFPTPSAQSWQPSSSSEFVGDVGASKGVTGATATTTNVAASVAAAMAAPPVVPGGGSSTSFGFGTTSTSGVAVKQGNSTTTTSQIIIGGASTSSTTMLGAGTTTTQTSTTAAGSQQPATASTSAYQPQSRTTVTTRQQAFQPATTTWGIGTTGTIVPRIGLNVPRIGLNLPIRPSPIQFQPQ
ncbi:unnamed protein product [Amoebophrya sp. A25]|nr:unnamed protein product [Amoebophrya sp. A25]|eukprot:GSA25T00004004001.1